MKSVIIQALLLGLIFSTTSSAGDAVGTFTFTSDFKAGSVGNADIGFFAANQTTPDFFITEITSIQLTIFGLTSVSPADLNIFLLDPFGNSLEIIDNRGDDVMLNGANLTFSDTGIALPTNPDSLVDGTTYQSEVLDGFMDTFVGNSGGTDAWILVVIDDGGNSGGVSFDSFQISGTFVPEPATLALMGLGAFAIFRRKRR